VDLAAVPLDKILDGGGWAVAFWVTFYVARMVYTGRLVPRRTHEDTVTALEIERKRNGLILEQLGKQTDSMETFEAFVRALPQPVQPVAPRRARRAPTGEE
jgi:hypothetical protein